MDSFTQIMAAIFTPILLIIIFFYQRNKNKLLTDMLRENKDLSDQHGKMAKTAFEYANTFNIKKVEEYLKISEDCFKKKKEMELIDIHSEFEEKNKSIEDDKMKLLDKITKSTSEIDSLKADYKSLVEVSTERALAFSHCLCITSFMELLSANQAFALTHSIGLLISNKIDDTTLSKYYSSLEELRSKLSKVTENFQFVDIA